MPSSFLQMSADFESSPGSIANASGSGLDYTADFGAPPFAAPAGAHARDRHGHARDEGDAA
eukprot:CAMPEP_0179344844 /NCGR_PEP_ID=MMETSP0797-20121207/71724_1 /TAXON_ID=47934 /ORGANISM="Dinophysis acuminata, Strain DAEP01" /LENGTH=60 /DNA_ID=CAMNT_0021059287 /DNA_START=51 /DNA_END=230 /DNA_ORIENTATION=+